MPNLVAFIVGVEIGQLLALSAILILMGYWRRTVSFTRYAYSANVALMAACFVLVGYQLAGLDAMDRARSRGETLRFALRIPEFDGLRRQVRFRWIST